jgi:hypothetical protein
MSKKVIVPASNFINTSVSNPHAQIRFRILSDDFNRISEWSPIYSIDPTIVFVRGSGLTKAQISAQKNTTASPAYVSVSWDSVSIYKDNDGTLNHIQESPEYDVWIQWTSSGNPANWYYLQRITATSTNIVIPSQYPDPITNALVTPTGINIEIYRPGYPISRYYRQDTILQNSSNINLTDNSIFFQSGSNYSTGVPIVYNSSNPIGGLSNGTYYVRAINYNSISLHPTDQDAFAGTNIIDLNGTLTGSCTISGYPFRMYIATLAL